MTEDQMFVIMLGSIIFVLCFVITVTILENLATLDYISKMTPQQACIYKKYAIEDCMKIGNDTHGKNSGGTPPSSSANEK